MTNPTPHGQVPEALIDLIDAYAETRHRCGGIYNARTEVARKAVIEALSGVQALSAAPEAIAKLRHLYQNMVNGAVRDTASAKRIAEGLLAPAIEALERATPPAEQQAAPKAAPTRTALPEGWTDCTIEFGNDGPEVVAYGPKRMMTRLAKWLGKYFAQVIADAAPKAAPGEPRFNCWSTNEGDSWFDHPADAQAIYDCLGNDAKVGDEYELTAGWNSVTARYRITEVVGDGEEYEVECISHPRENTAPQQEAQEPIGWAADRVRIEKTEKNGWCAYLDIENEDGDRIGTINLCRGINSENAARTLAQSWVRELVPEPKQVAAPQPAPAPLTDAQIAEMMRDTWGCASIAPRHALEFARAVERAHGITQKGGD